MFGADTPLVMDALQMAGIAVAVTGMGVFLLMRKRGKHAPTDEAAIEGPGDLENRVRVLERIATDQSIGLADEIEALRDQPDPSRTLKKASQ